jgi:pimeloyl-ACP methyl ester carboxylesterase
MPASTSPVPSPLRVPGNGLSHHVLEWQSPAASATVLLLHGFADAAATWDLVAAPLALAGFRVVAPDLRGFGDGPRVASGGYYYFPDYIHDVADIVEALVPPSAPLFVVGHSMGGTVATLYAGSFVDRPARLAVLEGAGPPDMGPEVAPDRMRNWIDGVRSARQRGDRTLSSRDEALKRLAANHPHVPEDVIRSRLEGLARPLPDGRWAWKADPTHLTRTPIPFSAAGWMAFARRVKCPVLFVSGGPLGWHPPGEADRIGSYPHVKNAEIPGAGHMMHWTRPVELTQMLLEFFRS